MTVALAKIIELADLNNEQRLRLIELLIIQIQVDLLTCEEKKHMLLEVILEKIKGVKDAK